MIENTEWYKDWFDETYLSLYRHRDIAEARSFLNWVSDNFSREASSGVADLACGAGRHSWIMAAEFGWSVTGLDLSASLLQVAHTGEVLETEIINPISQHSEISQPGFVRGDLKRLPYLSDSFGLVLNMFTSFGYFSSDQENLDSLKEMARIAKNGTVVLLDHLNKIPVLDNLVTRDENNYEKFHVIQDRQYDDSTKRIIKNINIIKPGGTTRNVQESVRLFSYDEFGTFFRQAGLNIEGAIGDYQGNDYNEKSSPRMILWARKKV